MMLCQTSTSEGFQTSPLPWPSRPNASLCLRRRPLAERPAQQPLGQQGAAVAQVRRRAIGAPPGPLWVPSEEVPACPTRQPRPAGGNIMRVVPRLGMCPLTTARAASAIASVARSCARPSDSSRTGTTRPRRRTTTMRVARVRRTSSTTSAAWVRRSSRAIVGASGPSRSVSSLARTAGGGDAPLVMTRAPRARAPRPGNPPPSKCRAVAPRRPGAATGARTCPR